METRNRRTAIIGALTLVALITSFVLAIQARGPREVALVIVAPEGTQVFLEGARSRTLPQQPNTAAGLTSHYFMSKPGRREVRFREPGKGERVQAIEIAQQSGPVIYTLLRDSLHEMRARGR